ncbi:MAG: glutamine synthetase [Pseudonocardiaceae bacterium]|nr:glutamine synthetase [Pseudonocardiaceae bacterium]
MSEAREISVGRRGFIERHGLWDAEQQAAAAAVLARMADEGIKTVRLAFPDQHGIVRGKWLTSEAFATSMRNGMDFAVSHYCWDTGQEIVFNPFSAGGGFGRSDMSGFPNALLVPDPLSFRPVPWAQHAGWIVADMYFHTGEPVPFAPRHVLRGALDELARRGLGCVAGLEVEWYLTKLVDPMLEPDHLGAPGWPATAPRVQAAGHGYQYQMDSHLDELEPLLSVLTDHLRAAGLPLRSIEDEWGPGQLEFTFSPLEGMAAADAMMFFRVAVKQICRRLGYLATFMCQPAIPHFYSSGWHLHQSLTEGTTNAFIPASDEHALSEIGMQYMGGLLNHAAAASVFTTPTINGYRRVKPFSLAPDRATWGVNNRGAMLKVEGGVRGDPSAHIENRIGEPAATPYLYLASQIVAGLDGIDSNADPGAPSETPYEETSRPLLPTSLADAVAALEADPIFMEKFGQEFVDLIVTLKKSEIKRYQAHLEAEKLTPEDAANTVTEWEQHEYFEVF